MGNCPVDAILDILALDSKHDKYFLIATKGIQEFYLLSLGYLIGGFYNLLFAEQVVLLHSVDAWASFMQSHVVN